MAHPHEVAQWQPQLFAFAYRLTGRTADSEDVVQEVLANWFAREPAQVADPLKYLARAVRNRCLTLLQHRPPSARPTLPEPLIQPAPAVEAHIDVSYGLLVLLARLSPLERSVFLLKESFGFDYAELADTLAVQPAYCRQLYHRAQQHLRARRQRFAPSGQQQRQLFQAFCEAIETGDLQALIQLLKRDVTVYSDGGTTRPAALQPITGQLACARFLVGLHQKFGSTLTYEPTQLNNSLGLLLFQPPDATPDTMLLLDYQETTIDAVYLMRDPEKMHWLRRSRNGS
ncbi:MAG: sigma factor [Janthinobacterium lividum]